MGKLGGSSRKGTLQALSSNALTIIERVPIRSKLQNQELNTDKLQCTRPVKLKIGNSVLTARLASSIWEMKISKFPLVSYRFFGDP